jgi:hypothetical protein
MSSEPRSAPTSHRRRRWTVLAVSLGASFLLAELLARAFVGSPLAERLPLELVRANRARGWEMVPGKEHYTYQHRVAVNSLGLRGPEVAAKAAGEQRVLFLGDSLTYGQGVADEETLPAALERALRVGDAEVRSWSVVNGGVRAYGTAQELGLLDELGARVQPDFVLLGWYWNDVRERPIEATYQELLPKGEFYFDTGNRLEGAQGALWTLRQLARRSALVMFAYDVLLQPGENYTPADYENGFARLGGLLDHLREACAKLGATPVVVVVPDQHRLTGGQATRPHEERAAALAREHSVAVIELLPALEVLHAATQRVPILAFDGHYDAGANRAMGSYLAERLLALGVKKRTE